MIAIIGTLIGFIIWCLFAGFAFWAAQQLIGLVKIAEPFATLIRIALYGIALLIVVYALTILLGMIGISIPTFGHMR